MEQIKKILLVDKEEEILERLHRFLESDAMIEVIKCKEITLAEYAIQNTHFDMVIADIGLSGVLGREGLEILSYIREKSPGTSVIVTTDCGSNEIKREAYKMGAYFYLDKPIDLRILKGKLEELNIYHPRMQ